MPIWSSRRRRDTEASGGTCGGYGVNDDMELTWILLSAERNPGHATRFRQAFTRSTRPDSNYV